MIVLSSILFAVALVGLLFLSLRAYLIRRSISVPVAIAGSGSAPSVIKIPSPVLQDTSRIHNSGDCYVVKGSSMMLCGIQDNDLFYPTPIEKNFKLPAVLLLLREHVENDNAKFKIRRAWLVCDNLSVPELSESLHCLLSSADFQKIKNEKEYPGDKVILNDFWNERYSRFKQNHNGQHEKVIISTTLHNGKQDFDKPFYNKIMFSIHSYSLIVGRIDDVYRQLS